MNDSRAKYNKRQRAGGLADDRFDCLDLRCVGKDQWVIELHCRFASRRDDVVCEGKQNTLFNEDGIKRLVLSAYGNSIKLEAHMEPTTFGISSKAPMEFETNFHLPNDMDMTLEPLSVCSVLFLHKYSVP